MTMRFFTARLLFSAAALAAANLAAQTIHTVGGSEPSFKTLVDALASTKVRDGDILHVRGGSYDAPDITKAVTIVGDAGVYFKKDFRQSQLVTVRDIGTGKALVLQNINFLTHLRVVSCAGRVHLGNVVAMAVTFDQCAALSVRDLSTGSGVGVQQSNTSFTNCTLWGQASLSGGRPGLAIQSNSRVLVAGGDVRGALGFKTIFNTVPPTAAVTCSDSHVTIMRDTQVTGGSLTGFSAPALQGIGSAAKLVLDPRATLTPTGVAAKHVGFTTVMQQRPPVVVTNGGELGKAAGISLLGSQDDLYVIALSPFRGGAVAVAPFAGRAWVDLASLQVLAVGKLPAAASVQLQWTTPSNPALRGLVVAAQGLAGPANGPAGFSNPGVFVVR